MCSCIGLKSLRNRFRNPPTFSGVTSDRPPNSNRPRDPAFRDIMSRSFSIAFGLGGNMIQGYATPPSISPGEDIRIHVASNGDATNFRTYFFRRGATWEFQGVSDIWTAFSLP